MSGTTQLDHIPALAALAVLLLTLPSSSRADIWGKPIMGLQFDRTPFREIKIPTWVEDLTTNLYGTFGAGEYELAGKLGVQIAEISFVDPVYVNYDSELLHNRNPNMSVDRIKQAIAEYKKRGIRIISAHGPWLQGEIYAAHPDWRAVPSKTGAVPEVDSKQNPQGGQLCMIGPWSDYLIEIVAEILTKFPEVDGFNFDGIHHFGPCYCIHCREAYRKEVGEDIPEPDMNDPAFRRYLLWQDRKMEEVVERMQRRIKSIKPDAAIVTYTTNAGRFGHLLEVPHGMSARMNLLFDAVDQEFWMDETNRGNSVVPAFANELVWAVTNHRVAFSTPYLMSHGNPYGTDSFPPQEYVRRAMLAVTHGAYPAMALGWPNQRESAIESVKELNRRAKWLTHKRPEPWAALVMGDYTRQFYGREAAKMEERYLSNVFGAFRAALEEHLPITVINEWNLNTEDLAGYRVLVLANTAVISDEQAEAIRNFVRNGGGLVATVDASLFDELGNPRSDFALADVFGVHYGGVISSKSAGSEQLDINFLKAVDESYWEKRRNIFDLKLGDHEIANAPTLRRYLGGLPVTFKGQAVRVSPAARAQEVGSITLREPNSAPCPAVVVHKFGKGKVVYMSAGFDSAYYMYPYPYQRLLLAEAMRWAAAEPPRISVEAPMCVHSTFFRQTKNGERLIVHLFNDLDTTANHAKPDDDVPLCEETIPIHDIKVLFRGYNVSRVHLEPEGVDLPPVKTADGLEVTVPKLSIHSMVVAELVRD